MNAHAEQPRSNKLPGHIYIYIFTLGPHQLWAQLTCRLVTGVQTRGRIAIRVLGYRSFGCFIPRATLLQIRTKFAEIPPNHPGLPYLACNGQPIAEECGGMWRKNEIVITKAEGLNGLESHAKRLGKQMEHEIDLLAFGIKILSFRDLSFCLLPSVNAL